MSLLTVNPRPEVFSSIPLIHHAAKDFEQNQVADLLPAVGQVFVKHKVYEKYGLSLLHRHFDMNNNEIMVEAMNRANTVSLACPWTFKGSSATPAETDIFSSHDLQAKAFVIPKSWCFNEYGELCPFEYVTSDKEAEPSPTSEFALELYSALKALNVEGSVGVIRIDEEQKGIASWETTEEGTRGSLTVFGPRPEHLADEEMVRVGWAFDKDGQLCKQNHWCLLCLFCGRCSKEN